MHTSTPLPSEVGRFWQMVWELGVVRDCDVGGTEEEFGINRTPPYWDESDNLELKEEDKMDFGAIRLQNVMMNFFVEDEVQREDELET